MKKHILIAICGMSPAVITETVYALSDDPPDVINVITTKLGHAAIVREIFDSRVWDALMRQPRFMDKKISFSPGSNHIRLLPLLKTDWGSEKASQPKGHCDLHYSVDTVFHTHCLKKLLSRKAIVTCIILSIPSFILIV